MQPTRDDFAGRAAPPLVPEPIDLGATGDSLERMMRYFAEYGDVYRIHAPTRRRETWVIADPADVKRVLVTNHRNYTKGVGLDRVKLLLGNGIMVSEGDFWRRQRLLIQPAFHRRMMQRFGPLIRDANERRLGSWERAARDGTPIDLTTELSELTLEIVLRSIFGTDYERMQAPGADNPFAVVTRRPERDLAFAYRFRSLAGVVLDIARRRRRANETDHFDLLGWLMTARDTDTGESMNDGELVDEILTLVVAGHETTASALNWTWYLLAQHPQAEASLHREVDAVANLDGESPANDERLALTRQVIKESLRLYPPGWLITRRSIGTDWIAGYELPAGTDVFLSPYVIHRHPRYYADPDRFLPERFTAQAEQARPRSAYIPFVAGPRRCVGEALALHEMTMHMYLTARRFRLRYVDDGPVALEAQINLRPARNLRFVPELRGAGR